MASRQKHNALYLIMRFGVLVLTNFELEMLKIAIFSLRGSIKLKPNEYTIYADQTRRTFPEPCLLMDSGCRRFISKGSRRPFLRQRNVKCSRGQNTQRHHNNPGRTAPRSEFAHSYGGTQTHCRLVTGTID